MVSDCINTSVNHIINQTSHSSKPTTPDNMQFTHLAIALFGAPAAAPSDIFDEPPTDVEPVQFTGPNGNPVPQTCCILTRYGNLKCDSRKKCP
jgi:hypothetical protein